MRARRLARSPDRMAATKASANWRWLSVAVSADAVPAAARVTRAAPAPISLARPQRVLIWLDADMAQPPGKSLILSNLGFPTVQGLRPAIEPADQPRPRSSSTTPTAVARSAPVTAW